MAGGAFSDALMYGDRRIDQQICFDDDDLMLRRCEG